MSQYFKNLMSDPVYFISQIMGILTCLAAVISMLSKNMSKVLIFQLIGNLLVTVSFCLNDTLSAGIVCIIASLQTLVLFIMQKAQKKPKIWVLFLFIALYLCSFIFTFKSVLDILSVVTALTFSVGVWQEKPSNYRKIMLINSLAWILLCILSKNYSAIITYLVITASTVLGIIKYDLKAKEKTKAQ